MLFRGYWFSRTLPSRISAVLLGVLLIGIVRGASPTGTSGELKPEQIYESLLPSTVTLEVETRKGERIIGTAFLAVAPNRAVTAWHLVQDAKSVRARFADDEVADAPGYVDKDEQKDLALLQLPSGQRPLCRLVVEPPPIGSRSYVLGAPKGFGFSISDGLLSQTPTVDGFRQYQISCPISPGNSGGPVVNGCGEVLGVVAWSQKDAQNLNFATPATYLSALELNRPLTPWSAKHRTAANRKDRGRDTTERDAWVDRDPALGIRELREKLVRSAGKSLTVVVIADDGEETYRLVVPEGFVR